MRTSALRAAVIMAGLVAAALPLAASAGHSWGNYHWPRSSNPLQLDIGDNLTTSTWGTHFDVALADWNRSRVLALTAVPGGTRARTCKATTGRVEVCNDSYGNTGWLGVAGIYASGDHITAAYVKLNDTYYSSPTYDTGPWRQLVMCQEIGHAFGLAHQDENFNNGNLGTCMDYTNSPDSNQHPNQHDYDMLEQIYSHTDGGGGGGGGSCNPKSPKCNAGGDTPAGWGRLMSTSRDGHRQVFELDLGNGNKVITHVFWVEPRGRARHDH